MPVLLISLNSGISLYSKLIKVGKTYSKVALFAHIQCLHRYQQDLVGTFRTPNVFNLNFMDQYTELGL